MIEFIGAYHQDAKTEAVRVLVQFDGVRLHVWRLSDPFHRVLSSDVFHGSSSSSKDLHAIRLPDGSRITTDDAKAVEQLLIRTQTGRWPARWLAQKHKILVIVLSLGLFLFCARWLLKAGQL